MRTTLSKLRPNMNGCLFLWSWLQPENWRKLEWKQAVVKSREPSFELSPSPVDLSLLSAKRQEQAAKGGERSSKGEAKL
jgi:hypothetical protein